MSSRDVVVVGAGVIGASTAYHLARSGWAVTLLDRAHTPASATASGASAGGVRQQNRQGPELPLALYSIDIWQLLAQELEAELDYRQGGMAICIDDEALVPALRRRVEREQAIGLDVALLDQSGVRQLVPAISPGIVAASYCPRDGDANPLLTLKAFALAARRLGADVRQGCALTGIEVQAGRLVAVETTQGRIPCARLVVAAGAYTPGLLSRLGIALPIRSGCIQMMVTAKVEPILTPVLGWVGEGISLKQLSTGNFLIGGGWPGQGDPERDQADVIPQSMMKSADVVRRLIPRLAGVPVVRAWTGNESWGIDDMPVIDALPQAEGLYLAAGFSGHGFALSPGVGRLIAQWLTDDARPELLEPFQLGRFASLDAEEADHA